jgi:hypothetical protein
LRALAARLRSLAHVWSELACPPAVHRQSQFQQGGNQRYNTTNYAIAPDGSFRGQSRQPPRSAQVSIRYAF